MTIKRKTIAYTGITKKKRRNPPCTMVYLLKKQTKKAVSGMIFSPMYSNVPCCRQSAMLSDDGLSDLSTFAICHQLVKMTCNQFTDG